MSAVFALSSLVYPVGFFSHVQKEIAVTLPTYYSMVFTRSTMLKGTPLGVFTAELAAVAAFTVGTVVALQLGITYYRRTN